MAYTPVIAIGVAGVAFLAGSAFPETFWIESLARLQDALTQELLKQEPVAAKESRIAGPSPGGSPAVVSIVELVGVGEVVVILRDRNGHVLYRSDPRAGTTTFAKGTDLPIVTLKEDVNGPAVQHPVSRREERQGNEQPQGRQQRRTPVGCMTDISPLAKSSVDRTPSLCLALLDQSHS